MEERPQADVLLGHPFIARCFLYIILLYLILYVISFSALNVLLGHPFIARCLLYILLLYMILYIISFSASDVLLGHPFIARCGPVGKDCRHKILYI